MEDIKFEIEGVNVVTWFNEKVQQKVRPGMFTFSPFEPTLPLSLPPFSRFLYDHSVSGCRLFPFHFLLAATFHVLSLPPLNPRATNSIDIPHFYPLRLLSWRPLHRHYPRGCRTRHPWRQMMRASRPRPSPQLSTSL